MTKLTVLIDADVVAYKAAFSAQNNVFTIVKENGDTVETFSKKKAANEFVELLSMGGGSFTIVKTVIPLGHDEVDGIVDRIINKIKKDTKATDSVLFLTGKKNFRNDIATYAGYKEHRKSTEKPIHFDYVRERLVEKHKAIISENEEADDLLAMNHTSSTIISTIDKDLKTVPGLNHNLTTGLVIYVTQADADKFFAEQCLTGDSADNIKGISFYSNKDKKIGPKTAQKLLANSSSTEELYATLTEVYETYAGNDWYKKLNETGSLLHMQRELNQVFDIEDWRVGKYNKGEI